MGPEPMSDQRRQFNDRFLDLPSCLSGNHGMDHNDYVAAVSLAEDAIAEVDRLHSALEAAPTEAIRAVVDAATTRRDHIFDGLCPDAAPYPDEADSHARRDPECPVCSAIDAVNAWLAEDTRPETTP